MSGEPITDTLAVRVLSRMTDDLRAVIDRRDDTIARLTAEIEQVKAQNALLRREKYAAAEEAWNDECRREGRWG